MRATGAEPALTMTARANYERKMAHTYSEDVKRADFQHKLGMDKMLMGNATSDERVANKRRARVAGEQAQVSLCHHPLPKDSNVLFSLAFAPAHSGHERAVLPNLSAHPVSFISVPDEIAASAVFWGQEREIEARIKQAGLVEKQRGLAEKEASLAAELERRKNERAREERVIDKVRAEAPELRDLEQKLRAAYMNQVAVRCIDIYTCIYLRVCIYMYIYTYIYIYWCRRYGLQ